MTEAEIQAEMLSMLESLGWTVVDRTSMALLRDGRTGEAIVEPLLREAIGKLNPALSSDEIDEAVAQVRRLSSERDFMRALRDGVPLKTNPDSPTRDVVILDSRNPTRNSFVATDEFVLDTGAARHPRLDVVLLVNGLPLGAIENKGTTHDLAEAASDWAGYWVDAPGLRAQVCVVGCCNGLQLKVGPSGGSDLDGYIDWTDAWPYTVGDQDDAMLVGLTGVYSPHTLVDLAVNFLVFQTHEGRATKILARAQQFRAANKIVTRVVDGTYDRGLIWHATGSGKSLTMVFAARKLMRAGLGGPTIVIALDRTQLDEQISETLISCDFEGVKRATGEDDLRRLLASAPSGVVITMIQKFNDEMAGLVEGHPVIVFADEAHRTQFGSFGLWMRAALPDASYFGFTGTPIEIGGRSTRAAFSPVLPSGELEPYLDRYGFDEAIADGATVPVVYESRVAEWALTAVDIDQRFDEVTEGLTDEQRDVLRTDAARVAVVAKAPARIAAISADVADQVRRRFAIAGFGAQLVAVDREACALYAEALSAHLQADEFAVIMSRRKSDATVGHRGADLRRWYPAAQMARLRGAPQDEDSDGVAAELDGEFVTSSDDSATRDFIARFRDPDDPLQLLIVNSMLLTGFDAPSEQALLLDRPLRGHTLIQAIARTNRRFKDKDHGVVVDYWGVFDHLEKALHEFATEDLAGLAEDIGALIGRLPGILDDAYGLLTGLPEGATPRRQMAWLMHRFLHNEDDGRRFEELVRDAQSIFETCSPDPRLAPYAARYRTLLEIWLTYRQATHRSGPRLSDLRAKTRLLVQGGIATDGFSDVPPLVIDAGYLESLRSIEDLTADEMAADIEAALVHEVKVRGEDDPLARTISEQLERLRDQRERGVQATLDLLADLQQIADSHIAAQQAVQDRGLSASSATIYQALARAIGPDADDALITAAAMEMGQRVDAVAGFQGWTDRADVVRGVRQAVLACLAADDSLRSLALDGATPEAIVAALGAAAR